MCDARRYDQLLEEHNDLEDRVIKLERSFERTDERIVNLISSVSMLSKCVYGVLAISFLVMLFTVVYGAVGERGFKLVSEAVEQVK